MDQINQFMWRYKSLQSVSRLTSILQTLTSSIKLFYVYMLCNFLEESLAISNLKSLLQVLVSIFDILSSLSVRLSVLVVESDCSCMIRNQCDVHHPTNVRVHRPHLAHRRSPPRPHPGRRAQETSTQVSE